MLKTSLWPHQQQAVAFALDEARQTAGSHPGAGLWYEMGTGKTLAALTVLHERQARRVLVLAPSVVCSTWTQQVQQHLETDLRCVALTQGSCSKRLDALRTLWTETGGKFIVALNYEAAALEPFKTALPKATWDAVVLDEAHRGKGPTTNISKWLRERLYPVSRYTLALTGTPLPNGYQDAYGLYSAFAPATFDVRNWTHFRARYAVRGNPRIPQQITGWNNADDIRARMTRHAISCRAADVLDLPDAIHETIWVDLDPATARGYAQMEALMVAEVAGSEVTAANALVKALRLQQIAGGVFKTDDGVEHRVGREKERALTDMLECIDRREPVVCFAQFRSDLESIHVAARAHGRPSFEVSGNVKQVQEWSAACGDGAVMAAQIAAGGLGINEFVAARFCFFLSTGYSSAAYRQAVARLHRHGQARNVMYYHVAARGTVDESIAAALQRKGDLEAAVMERLRAIH